MAILGPEARFRVGELKKSRERRKALAARHLLQLQQEIRDVLDLVSGRADALRLRVLLGVSVSIPFPHGIPPCCPVIEPHLRGT